MPNGKRRRKNLKWWAQFVLRAGSLILSFFRLFM